jgi:hypothetical protein
MKRYILWDYFSDENFKELLDVNFFLVKAKNGGEIIQQL